MQTPHASTWPSLFLKSTTVIGALALPAAVRASQVTESSRWQASACGRTASAVRRWKRRRRSGLWLACCHWCGGAPKVAPLPALHACTRCGCGGFSRCQKPSQQQQEQNQLRAAKRKHALRAALANYWIICAALLGNAPAQRLALASFRRIRRLKRHK